jgi:predicted phosphodiesterase
MRIQIASDLHLEHIGQRFPGYRVIEPADADLLILAGDIHNSTYGLEAFKDWPVPVIYIHGNHEAYGLGDYAELTPALRRNAEQSNVHYLERDEFIFMGVRFLGCCLWTDYCLHGKDNRPAAMKQAERFLRDHGAIHAGNGKHFAAPDALGIHTQSRAWLERQLDAPSVIDGSAAPTVVITHHAPHPKSVHPRFAGNPLNAAFVSDLTPLLGQAALWIHGHTHDSFDYEVNGTRIIANPRGYARNRKDAARPDHIVWENPGFDPCLVIEV